MSRKVAAKRSSPIQKSPVDRQFVSSTCTILQEPPFGVLARAARLPASAPTNGCSHFGFDGSGDVFPKCTH